MKPLKPAAKKAVKKLDEDSLFGKVGGEDEFMTGLVKKQEEKSNLFAKE